MQGTSAQTARHYRLYVLPESPSLTFPGSKPAPSTGFAAAGPVVPQGDPTVTANAKWFQRFSLAPGDLVSNNFAELDSSSMSLVKIATRSSAMIGDIVGYIVTLQNPGSQDLLVDSNGNGGVHIDDVLPAALRYAAGSARADRLVANGSGATNATGVQPAADRHCPRISQDAQGTACPAAKQGPALPETGKAGQKTVGANLDFGPYDLRSGETLELRYQAVVQTNAAPGDALNSAVARSGGVNVSNSDSAIVRIAQDPLFDLSSLIGKVYCESDATPFADHRQEKGEEGVPGVRIYEDEGWFAESDATGKFHFVGLQPGLHRFKIDVRTLPPGDEPLDDGSVTMNLTAGLDARRNFAITCHRALVGPDRVGLKITPPPPVPPRSITADASALEVKLDGAQLLLSRGALRLFPDARDTREDIIQVAPGAAAKLQFEPLVAGGPVPASWRVSLSDAAGTLLGEATGAGAPPNPIELSASSALPIGATVRAQLELKSANGRYLSPLLALRVVPVQPPDEVVDSFLLRGTLFEEQNANATRELARQLQKPIDTAKAKPELLVDIEVHTAGGGSPDAERALSEQRARAVREAMLAAGVAPERLHARGRGSDVPLAINVTEKARLQNRRISIQLLKPPPPPPGPEPFHTDALSTLDAKPLAITAGQPIAELPVGQTAAIVLQRTDGARAEFEVPKEPLAAPVAPIAVRLDVGARTLSVGGFALALPLLGLSVEPLVDDAPSRRVVLDAGGVPRALAFSLRAPVDGVSSWRLLVDSPEGGQAAELTGAGVPPRRISWPEGKPLAAGLLRARLTVRTADGSEGRSPLAEFQAAPPQEPVLRESQQAGGLFPGRGKSLSKEGLAKAKLLADKLLAAAGPGGKFEVDVFSDDEADAQQVTDGRATALRKALIADGLPEPLLAVHARGAVLPIAPNATAPGRRANNRVVFSAIAAEKPLPAIEPMPASVRAGDALLHPDGANFAGELSALPPRLALDLHLASGAGASVQLELPFSPAAPAGKSAPLVSAIHGSSAESMASAPANSVTSLGSSTAPPPAPAAELPPPPAGPQLILPEDLPLPGTAAPSAQAAPSSPPPAPASSVPASALPGSSAAQPPAADASASAASSASSSGAAPAAEGPGESHGSGGRHHGAQPGAAPEAASAAPAGLALSSFAISEVPAGGLPLAAKLTADLPASGTVVRAEALWVRGTTDPHNKLTLNGVAVKLDAQGNFAARAQLHRGDESLVLTATDPSGESATIERKVHVDPDGLFLLLLGEGDFGQGGAQLDGVGTRTDFGGLFLKGRASGVVEGRWDISDKVGGLFKDLQLSGNFDTARTDDPDAFVELYNPSHYYPVNGDSGLFGQQAASQGPVYLNLKADQSHLIIGNFKTEPPASTEVLFRFDCTLYGIDLNLQKTITGEGGRPIVDSKLDLFGADGDLRQHHAHGELRGTGGSVYYLKDSDVIEGSDQVTLVVRDANTGVQLTTITETRDVDYTIQAAEGRVIFKQAIPSVADASFLANANYSTPMAGNPVFVVVDYEYRGAIGAGGHAGGAHIQETLFNTVTVGGGVASENYSGASTYTLGGINLGIKPKPHTFLNVEVAQSSGTDSESYTSVDGGLTFGSLAPTCSSTSLNPAACNATGRALRIEAGFELADWLNRKPAANSAGAGTIGTANSPPPLPTPTGMSGIPAVGPGDLLRANLYFDTRDQGFYTSGGDMD